MTPGPVIATANLSDLYKTKSNLGNVSKGNRG